MDRCGAPCEGRIVRRSTARIAAAGPRRDGRRPAAADRAAAAARWPGCPTRAGTRRRRPHRDRLATFAPGRPRGCSGWPALTRSRSWSPPGRTAPAAGSCRWSGTAGSSAAGVAGRGADPSGRTAASGRRPPSRCCPGAGPLPARPAEETERILRWLEAAGHPAGRADRHLGLPDPRRRRSAAVGRGREQRPRPARPVRRPPGHPAGAPAGRRGQPDRLTVLDQTGRTGGSSPPYAEVSTSTSPPRTCSTLGRPSTSAHSCSSSR